MRSTTKTHFFRLRRSNPQLCDELMNLFLAQALQALHDRGLRIQGSGSGSAEANVGDWARGINATIT
jgi:hypothetical protein